MAPRDNEQGADPVASGAESGNTYTQVPALASASWSGPFCTDQFAHARVPGDVSTWDQLYINLAAAAVDLRIRRYGCPTVRAVRVFYAILNMSSMLPSAPI